MRTVAHLDTAPEQKFSQQEKNPSWNKFGSDCYPSKPAICKSLHQPAPQGNQHQTRSNPAKLRFCYS